MKTRGSGQCSVVSGWWSVISIFLFFLLVTAGHQSSGWVGSLVTVSYAEEDGVKDENAPIKITANRMETQNGKNAVSFLENVVAKKGDMTIYANRIDVYSDKDKKKLIKIIATGDVKIEKGMKVATGAEAEYYEVEQKLILRGNPKLKEKDNLIEGSEIIYYIKEENVTVHGDENKKVEVTLFPEEKK
jgi:lipopolysaccharide export system protein LptA